MGSPAPSSTRFCRIGAQAAQALARDELHLDGDEGPCTRLLQRCGRAGAQAVRPHWRACRMRRIWSSLCSQFVAVGEIGVEGVGRGLPAPRIHIVRAGQRVHLGRPALGQRVVTRKWRLSRGICLMRRWLPSSVSLRNSGTACRGCAGCAPAPEMANSLTAMRQLSKCQVQGFSCAATRWHSQWVSKPVTNGSGPMRRPLVIEPQRRLAGNGGEAMAREVRERMRKACRVVPHLAGVGDLRAQVVGGPVVQAAVGERVAPLSMVAGHGAVGASWRGLARGCR